jgi:hypothetical protein
VHPRCRYLLACVVFALIVLGACACGGSSHSSPAASSASSAAGAVAGAATSASSTGAPAGAPLQDGDGDDDRPGSKHDPDTDEVFTYGTAAGPADRQAITALITRYYALAAAGDGKHACKMLYWLVAEGLVEEHSHGKGPATLRGSTCAQVATKVFMRRHGELAADVKKLEVTEIRVHAKKAWVRVRFGPTRELLMFVHRTGGVWQMNNLLDAGAV